jgi:hypothetical protein
VKPVQVAAKAPCAPKVVKKATKSNRKASLLWTARLILAVEMWNVDGIAVREI